MPVADLVEKMKSELRDRRDGYPERFEELLGQVIDLGDHDCVGQLLTLFDDFAEYDEIMFSVIHAIERFDDATYVREVTRHLVSFLSAAPRWAAIVHMRILNSPQTLEEYASNISNLSGEQLQAVRHVLEAVQKRHPKFESRCSLLLGSMQS